MPTTDPTPIAVFPTPIPVTYIPLPVFYPELPLNGFEFQPVAYTQGRVGVVYVTGLVAVSPRQQLEPFIDCTLADNIYKCVVRMVTDPAFDNTRRLAYFGFMFFSELQSYKVEISVMPIDGEQSGPGTIGKVVMDSNMLPTEP